MNDPGRQAKIGKLLLIICSLGIVAGVAVLILRFHTGSDNRTRSSSPLVRLSAEARELQSALADWSGLHEKLKKTRWQATAMRNEDLRELGLEDLRTTMAAQREFRDATQRVHLLVTKLNESGTLSSVRRELLSQGVSPNSLNPEIVRMMARLSAAAHEANALVEANWEDYRTNGLPTAKEDAVTPWQKEATALREEMLSLQAEATKISEAAATAAK